MPHIEHVNQHYWLELVRFRVSDSSPRKVADRSVIASWGISTGDLIFDGICEIETNEWTSERTDVYAAFRVYYFAGGWSGEVRGPSWWPIASLASLVCTHRWTRLTQRTNVARRVLLRKEVVDFPPSPSDRSPIEPPLSPSTLLVPPGTHNFTFLSLSASLPVFHPLASPSQIYHLPPLFLPFAPFGISTSYCSPVSRVWLPLPLRRLRFEFNVSSIFPSLFLNFCCLLLMCFVWERLAL